MNRNYEDGMSGHTIDTSAVRGYAIGVFARLEREKDAHPGGWKPFEGATNMDVYHSLAAYMITTAVEHSREDATVVIGSMVDLAVACRDNNPDMDPAQASSCGMIALSYLACNQFKIEPETVELLETAMYGTIISDER